MVRTQGKTGFLKELFVDQPDAGKAAVDEAWRDAGNDGTISDSLISKVRAELGLAGKRGRKAGVKSGKRAVAVAQTRGRDTGAKVTGRSTTSVAQRDFTTDSEPAARSKRTGADRGSALIRLEGEIDEMLHEIKVTGGLSEFEDALRRARRILARSHAE